jgi:shikimate kinase
VDAARVVPASFRLVFRGAGKSTIGALIIIFDLYGLNGYRRMEREALESILKQILRGTIIYK